MYGVMLYVFNAIQVRDGGQCNLSEATAADVGQLNTDAGRMNLVHHFEMKPILGQKCHSVLVAKEFSYIEL